MKRLSSLKKLGYKGFCLIFFSCQQAAGDWKETFQYHGFLSQNFVLTSENNFYGESKRGSFDFAEAGFNVSLRPFSRLGLAAQVLYRRAGELEDEEVRLDYGVLEFGVLETTKARAGVRLGRVKNPLGLYNETRDVAFTRPSIFLPQSIYFDRTRNWALSSDGGQVYGQYESSIGEFSLRVNVGVPTVDKSLEGLQFGRNQPGEFDGNLSYLGQFLYEYQSGLVRLAFTAASAHAHYHPGHNDRFFKGDFWFQPYIFSAQYNGERLSVTGEYALRDTRMKNFGPLLPNTAFTGESYYIQGAYRLTDEVEAMVRYDVYYQDVNDRYGERRERRTGRPGFTRFAKDWTVGLRWDITPNWMARVEYHRIHGVGWLASTENPDTQKLDPDWDLFALELSFRF
jgi:opacity protein-like surface antigen